MLPRYLQSVQNCEVSDEMSDVTIKDANYVATREELSSGKHKMA